MGEKKVGKIVWRLLGIFYVSSRNEWCSLYKWNGGKQGEKLLEVGEKRNVHGGRERGERGKSHAS